MLAADTPTMPVQMRAAVQTTASYGLLILFVITLMVPIAFEIAGVRLSPNRLFLLLMFVPFAMQVISGQVGRFTSVDLLVMLHGFWMFVALIAVHGTTRIPFAGISAVEILGGYLAGRVLVTNALHYRVLFRAILIALICLLPFAVYESFTGKLVIPDLLRPLFETPERGRSAYGRMGLERVYGVFVHPILWGLFCAITLANFVVLARGNKAKIAFALLFVGYTTFLALSSAPMMAYGLQIALLMWAWIIGGRWKSLLIFMTVTYVVVDLLSDRTPVTILIETLTFNPLTGYTRIAIFDAGWAAVERNPIFGIGFNDWPRPHWLTSSVDNFWLLKAMRYGLVGVGFLAGAFAMHFWLLARAKVYDPERSAIRLGHTIALAGLTFTLVTVHVWDTIAVFVMFYLGAGAWIYTQPDPVGPDGPAEDTGPQDPAAARTPVYTRFPTQNAQTLQAGQTGQTAGTNTAPSGAAPRTSPYRRGPFINGSIRP